MDNVKGLEENVREVEGTSQIGRDGEVDGVTSMDFHVKIKCTSLTYLHGEWPISHRVENI